MTLRKRTLLTRLGWLLFGGCAATSAQTTDLGPPVRTDAGPPAKTVLFPLEAVRPGLTGTAYTVFEGVRPESMSVEILGRLNNALGPKRDLILARLHGSKPEYTGVVAGMSGSPVYIDGKLLGALSYRIGQFSKEPIAGITPIAQMLEVANTPNTVLTTSGRDQGKNNLQAMEAPLVFSGFSQETVTRFGDGFKAMGLTPVTGLGGANPQQRQPEPLEPGSVVSALLVGGDLSVAATCTVSYIDADRLLACGHPLTQSGEIDVPMAKAEVLATLASPLNSFKIVNATEIVGAFKQDRSSAIYGRLGAHAQMIPVSVTLSSTEDKGVATTMHFVVANHRELTPQLMMAAIYQCLQQRVGGSTEASYKLDGQIRLSARALKGSTVAPLPPVEVAGWQTQSGFNSGAVNTALAVGDRFSQLFGNAEDQPQMTGVDLRITTSGQRRAATLESAHTSLSEVHSGQTLTVDTLIQPYQASPQRVTTSVTLPQALQPGTLRLLVSDGATLDRLAEPSLNHSLSLSDTVARLNRSHANDRIYVTVLSHEAEAFLDATPLAEVPLSLANVLEPLKATQRLRLTGESVLELGSSAAEDAVSGSQVLTIVVR